MHPEQRPWLANPDWVRKRIPGTVSSNLKMSSGGWLTGVFALVIGSIGLLLKGPEAWNQKGPFSLVLLIFPIVGITLLYWSALLKLRARKYSGTYFEMGSLPFLLGETLFGKICVPSSGGLRGTMQVTLNCVRRRKSWSRGVTGRAKTTSDDLVWRQEKLVPIPDSTRDAGLVNLPVEFSLPRDAPTTDSANPDDRILWSLRASAKVWGVDFLQYFEVPVFTPSGVSPRPQYGDLDFYAPVAVTLPATPPSGDRQVVERPSADGGTEFLFLANRHWGIAKFATVAFFAWTAVLRYFLWGSDSLSFSFFVIGDLLLLYWALWGWFSKASATFKDGTVTVRISLLGIGKSKRVPYSDIRRVTSPDASQSGQGTEAIPSYAIYLETASQGTVALASSLRSAGEAGYIVERIKAEIGRPH